MHFWCSGHFASINDFEVWGVSVGVLVSRREFHVHTYTFKLGYSRNSILY